MISCRSVIPKNLSRNFKRIYRKPIYTQSRAMAFLPRTFYDAPESSFTPLFRLLDDFDNYARRGGSQELQGKRSGLPVWQPKFDLRETSDNYELYGELPGMNKEHVHIEFSDPQTMSIRGRVERTYSAGTPPTGHTEGGRESGAITEGDEHKNGHQATVEDERSDNNKASQGVVKVDQRKPVDNAKYWLSERSIGEFSRTFNFPARIDQDAVVANFKDGILSIQLPKAKKQESRRVAIS